MTLPFRGRHHDGESPHDRARALASEELLGALAGEDAAWLAKHVEACGECRAERAAWDADRQLLRSLRDRPMEPPRDLWARTSAAIDRESGAARRRRAITGSGRAAGRDVFRGLPFGAAAGTLVVLVVVGASLFTRTITPPSATPRPSTGVATTDRPQPTNLEVAAGKVGWIRQGDNGTWELVLSEVDEVCPRTKDGCELLDTGALARPLDIGTDATGLTISPDEHHLVVEQRGDASAPGKVYVVPVPTAGPASTPAPTSEPTSGPVVTDPPATPEPPSSDPPASEPPATPAPGSAEPSPSATPGETPGTSPPGAIEIATGVTMVGEAAYSADGQWLAFSARPADDSAGPDLYLWRVGDPTATKVTDDHQTYFSSWHRGQVLASRVIVPAPVDPEASGEPAPSADATASPEPTTQAEATARAGFNVASPGMPESFLLDPATLVRTDLGEPAVWLPVVDPEGRFTAYWSGTLVPTADGLDWQLGEGRLVLDAWQELGEAPASSPDSAAATPDASAAPAPRVGPAGTPIEIPVGELAEFQAKFDPSGLRLALWAADEAGANVGRLHLVVLDPSTGTVDASITPLPGAPAVRRFSIDEGRLAWVSPRGQDGQESAVKVLGWDGRDFGEIQTIPSKDLFIVR